MNKKIIVLVLSGILSLSMIGCESSSSNSNNSNNSNSTQHTEKYTNKLIDTGDSYRIGKGDVTYGICYDSKTNIVYIGSPFVHNSGISLLYNKDLKPMTIDEYNNTNKDKDRFVDTGDIYKIGKGDVTYNICYDSETNIMYMCAPFVHNSGISVLIDTDGKPMTLAKYNESK